VKVIYKLTTWWDKSYCFYVFNCNGNFNSGSV